VVRDWKVREESALPLQSHRVIEGVQTLAAGLILKRLLLIQLFDARSKINALLASEAASGWPFILSEIPQTNKNSDRTRPT
jgi:hypothetical protein